MRMLIVDDSRTMRNFLSALAEELRFSTSQATDGEDALAQLNCDHDFDVALVDWDMPKMNGITLVDRIRRTPQLDAMKVMMVTSHHDMDSVCQALQKGADDFLMKPVTPEALTDKLRILGILD